MSPTQDLLGWLAEKHCRWHSRLNRVSTFCDPSQRWAFKATVYKSSNLQRLCRLRRCRSFQCLLPRPRRRNARGRNPCRQPCPAQSLRNRHLLGRGDRILRRADRSLPESRRSCPPQPANGNHGGPKVRDRLCQIIRQHQLDPNLVKAYATDFCGVKTLREATREQVENFVTHLADWAEKDRNALLCQLNSYPGQKKKVPHETPDHRATRRRSSVPLTRSPTASSWFGCNEPGFSGRHRSPITP